MGQPEEESMFSPWSISSTVSCWRDMELVERMGPEERIKRVFLVQAGAESYQGVMSHGVEEVSGVGILKHLAGMLKNFGET